MYRRLQKPVNGLTESLAAVCSFGALFTVDQERVKFPEDRSNQRWDIAIFVIFNMAAAAILDYQTFEILTVRSDGCSYLPGFSVVSPS